MIIHDFSEEEKFVEKQDWELIQMDIDLSEHQPVEAKSLMHRCPDGQEENSENQHP